MRRRSGRPSQRREPKESFPINRAITATEVRLIDGEGKMRGLVALREALRLADEAGLDLVEISSNPPPPVCKIIDYGKFLFQREKKKKETKKHQKVVQLKEIKMRPKTDVHDYNFKLRRIREFLASGNKVKVTVRFKGREMSFVDLGHRQINRVAGDLGDACKIEFQPKMEGRTLFMIVAPGKTAGKTTQKKPATSAEKKSATEENVESKKKSSTEIENAAVNTVASHAPLKMQPPAALPEENSPKA